MIDKWTLNYFDYWHLLEEGFLSCVLKISIDSSNWAIRSNWPKKSRLIQRTSSEFLLLYPLGEDSRLEEVWGAVKGGIIRNEIALNQRVIQSTAIYRSAGSKLWRNWNRRRPRCMRTIILNSACDERSRPARGNRTLIFYGVILACKKDEIEERDFFLTTFLLE